MKKIFALVLLICVLLGVFSACGNAEPGETTADTGTTEATTAAATTETTTETTTEAMLTVDEIPLETLLMLFADMAEGVNLSYCVRSALLPEDLGAFIGADGFTADFAEGMSLTPQMSSDAFCMAVFRLADGGDAKAFGESLVENADLVKWVCVAAETAEAKHLGNTVVFYMCSDEVAKALGDAFDKMCVPDFDYREHLKVPMRDMSVQEFYASLCETYSVEFYGFIDADEPEISAENLPQGFAIPETVGCTELLWNISSNPGSEWEPESSAFIAIIRDVAVDEETAISNAELLFDALQDTALPLGEGRNSIVAYSAEYGTYLVFVASGNWSYYTYDIAQQAQNAYRMDIYEAIVG